MTAYLGRVVRAVLPTVSASSAGGFWNPVMAQYYQQAGLWPDGSGADPYFPYNTLLLNGDGTNGAQNNTFLDGSTNNFTITRNGNTTQGAFNPYVGPGCWSNYFNGSSYLSFAANASLNILSGGDFTIEAWVINNASSPNNSTIVGTPVGGSGVGYSLRMNSSRQFEWVWPGVAAYGFGPTAQTQGVWYHIAICRVGNAITGYINGTGYSITSTTRTSDSGAATLVGADAPNNLYWNGFVSNLRIIKGTALYTTNFTPPTKPLIATTQTVLLTCNNNSFIDQSAANNVPTRNGSALVSKFSPFTLYQTTPASYSGYFDGTGDYLTAPANAAYAFGTGDFTVEAWVYPVIRNATYGSQIAGPHAYTVSADWLFIINTAGNLYFQIGSSSSGAQTSTSTVSLSTWSHVAVVRSSGTVTFYINGIAAGSGSYATSIANTQALGIGAANNGNSATTLTGSISNLRITKGQALYTTGFTPSTSPLTTTSQGATASNVSLLTCQSTTFIDNSTNAFTITANGNAIPERANPFTDTVTGPTPYSTTAYGGSAYFDGTGDYLTAPASNSSIWPGSGSFTIEYWLYLPANPSSGYYTHFSYGTSGSVLRVFNTAATSKIEVFSGASVILNPAWPTAGQWNHFALVRNGTTLTLYINGAVAQSVTNSTDFSTGTLTVGGESASNPLLGYISNFRIVKGTAVYTGPFVPPAAPVTAVTNTQLLLNGTNAGIFDSTTFADLETVGNTQISTSVVKYGTGSIYFDGAGDWLIVNSPNGANDYAFGSGDFTLEMWIYPTDITSVMLYDSRPNSSAGVYPTLYINSSSSITYYTNGSDRISGASAVINTWQHIALVRASGTTKLYINGTQSGSTYTDANTYLNGASRPIIGVDGGNTSLQNYAGYIDDLRITKGVARYTANFTPPAAAFPNF